MDLVNEGRLQRGRSHAIFSSAQGQDKGYWIQTGIREVPSEHQESLLYCADDGVLAQVAQEDCGGDLQMWPWAPALGGSA